MRLVEIKEESRDYNIKHINKIKFNQTEGKWQYKHHGFLRTLLNTEFIMIENFDECLPIRDYKELSGLCTMYEKDIHYIRIVDNRDIKIERLRSHCYSLLDIMFGENFIEKSLKILNFNINLVGVV